MPRVTPFPEFNSTHLILEGVGGDLFEAVIAVVNRRQHLSFLLLQFGVGHRHTLKRSQHL
jgi:hypothetical protein